jgi:fatty acid desaturase
MLTAQHALPSASSLRSDPRLKRKLRELCRTDNVTNFYYIARVYVVLALTIGGAVWFDSCRLAAGWSWLWNVPVFLAAILAVGASHHQLAGAGHEATHHTLFRNRWLNELASDWLCMFPVFSTTYSFRLFHLSHHQFINDPKRDPDFALLERSGHWLDFPVPPATFLGKIARQFLLVGLLKYILVRFRFNSATLEGDSPYRRKDAGRAPKLVLYLSVAYFVGLALVQRLLYPGDLVALWGMTAVGWAALALTFSLLPDRYFDEARLRPVVPRRVTAASRLAYLTLVFNALTTVRILTGVPVGWYFLWLWVVPLVTSFSLFMILRQLIQHGNGDRGWLTNTRVFLVNPLVRYAVFPFGMDYHLPHHMYATVPHYHLPELHRYLQQFPEYAQDALVVENYFIPKPRQPKRNPTVLEVVGPAYARRNHEVYIDNSVLDGWEVDEREEISRQSELSAGRRVDQADTSAAPSFRGPTPERTASEALPRA